MIGIFINILCFVIMTIHFLYAIFHLSFRKKVEVNLQSCMQKVNIVAIICYVLTIASPMVYGFFCYLERKKGNAISDFEEFIWHNGDDIWFLLLPALVLGITNLFLYRETPKKDEME